MEKESMIIKELDMIDMLHYSHEEFLGMKVWEVSPFKDKVFNQAAFKELQGKGYIRYNDLPLETKEGKGSTGGDAEVQLQNKYVPDVKIIAISGNKFFGPEVDLYIAETLGVERIFGKPLLRLFRRALMIPSMQ
jgi:hypothetical protein